MLEIDLGTGNAVQNDRKKKIQNQTLPSGVYIL